MTELELIQFNDELKSRYEEFLKIPAVKQALDKFKTRMSRTKIYTDVPTDAEILFEVQKSMPIFIELYEELATVSMMTTYLSGKCQN